MEQELLTKLTAQAEMVRVSITLMGMFVTLNFLLIGVLCKWVWDLKQKTSSSVSGDDCERRNDSHYKALETLRKEIKEDFAIAEKRFTESVDKMSEKNHELIVALLQTVNTKKP